MLKDREAVAVTLDPNVAERDGVAGTERLALALRVDVKDADAERLAEPDGMPPSVTDELREGLAERDTLAARDGDTDAVTVLDAIWLAPKETVVEALAATDALTERLAAREGDTERVTVGLKPV